MSKVELINCGHCRAIEPADQIMLRLAKETRFAEIRDLGGQSSLLRSIKSTGFSEPVKVQFLDLTYYTRFRSLIAIVPDQIKGRSGLGI